MEAGDWSQILKRSSCSLDAALKKLKTTINDQSVRRKGIQARLKRVSEALEELRRIPLDHEGPQLEVSLETKKEEGLEPNGPIDASHWKTFLDSLTGGPDQQTSVDLKESAQTTNTKRMKRNRVSENQATRKKAKNQRMNNTHTKP